MQLTVEEFHRIRKDLKWWQQQFGDEWYFVTNKPELFWISFIPKVFLHYFKKQQTVTRLTNFDIHQPVLLTNKLQLKLPQEMERIINIAKTQDGPSFRISLPVSQYTVLVVALIVYILCIAWILYFKSFIMKTKTYT